ncbi:MAG: hypothetical protein JXB88_16640 [Spirochaetales bacterium]|nr:hypothetical protein [Spirochaetales bacterium]
MATANKEKQADEKKKIDLIIVREEKNNYAINTDNSFELRLQGFFPVVDAHMHLQSNNCAPLTLQWGLLMMLLGDALSVVTDENVEKALDNAKDGIDTAQILLSLFCSLSNHPKLSALSYLLTDKLKELVEFTRRNDLFDITREIAILSDRESMNFLMSALQPIQGIKDFGRIGTLSTDNVARIFMKDREKLEAKEYYINYGISGRDKFVVMSKEKAIEIIVRQEEKYREFEKLTRYYFNPGGGTAPLDINHMYIAMPMDMTYAHYWAYYSIPVYLYINSKIYFINDYVYYLSIFDNIQYDSFFRKYSKTMEQKGIDCVKEQILKKVDDINWSQGREKIFALLDEEEKLSRKIEAGNEHERIPEDLKKDIREFLHEHKLSSLLIDLNIDILQSLKKTMEDFFTELTDEYKSISGPGNKKEKINFFYVFYHIAYRINNDYKTTLISELKSLKEKVNKQVFLNMKIITDYLNNIKNNKPVPSGVVDHPGQIRFQIKEINTACDELKEMTSGTIIKLTGIIGKIRTDANICKIGMGKIIPYDIKFEEYKSYFQCFNRESQCFNKNKKFYHFIQEVPGETHETFENYDKQFNYYLAACVRYPFRIMPFYHYDPRRHYKNDPGYPDIKKIGDDIQEYHSFFTHRNKGLDTPSIFPVEGINQQFFEATFQATYVPNGARRYSKGWKMKALNSEAFNHIQHSGSSGVSGLCLGFKMYCALGYPPDLYTDSSFPGKNKLQNRYKHVDDFFKQCAQEKIPITVHASPRGMTIGDSYLFMRASEKQSESKKTTKTGEPDYVPPHFIEKRRGESGIEYYDTKNKTEQFKEGWVYRWMSSGRAKDKKWEKCIDPNFHKWITVINGIESLYPAPDTSFKEKLFDINGDYYSKSLDYVDATFAHADAWSRVLKKHKTLKVCLAHFAGMAAWIPKSKSDVENEERIKKWNLEPREKIDWRKAVSKCISDNENVYTDISCFSVQREEIPNILSESRYESLGEELRTLVSKNKITSTDRSFCIDCYTRCSSYFFFYKYDIYVLRRLDVDERKRLRRILCLTTLAGYEGLKKNEESETGDYKSTGEVGDQLYHVADELASYLNGDYEGEGIKASKLKERIMMGSDWPMFERKVTGIGEYYSRMFEMLRFVTLKLKKKYDVWYQFAVLNPLRFLGIIDKDNKLDLTKLENHYKAVMHQIQNTTWMKKVKVYPDELDRIKEQAEKILNKYRRFYNSLKYREYKLPDAEDITGKDAEDFIILRK